VSPATHEITLSNDNFTVTSKPSVPSDPPPPLDADVPLGVSKTFNVHWDKGGSPEPHQEIRVSASRGTLMPNSGTGLDGNTAFTISSDNAGPVSITVSTGIANGPSVTFGFDFVADQPTRIDLQASPSSIGVNTVGSSTEQSTVTAVVRDARNNLVKGHRVEFTVDDITGGRITPSSTTTDQFGRATTVYFAGSSSSSASGAKVTAKLTGSYAAVTNSVTITVAKRSLFIDLGTTNKLESAEPKYLVPYTVLVTDVNGLPVEGSTVNLSIYPLYYLKGHTAQNPPHSGLIDNLLDAINTGVDPKTISKLNVCANEDANRNGILDTGEDGNGNGRLDPGNVITADTPTLVTGATGFKDFKLVYAKQYADLVKAELGARASVAGTEDQEVAYFYTACLVDDCPKDVRWPNQPNPFGNGTCDQPN